MSDIERPADEPRALPADMFKVQRSVLGQYHVTDAGSFYSRDDLPDDTERPDLRRGERCSPAASVLSDAADAGQKQP
ncbi:UPF0182 family protein, partial [Leifsonia poae]|uniref:UPF0182 family protein n=1 Tax=Leifsonia poae TaxID=110933 RepID=UPI0035A88279